MRTARSDRVYELREHPSFAALADLYAVADKPLAVIFESPDCDACADSHDRILADRETHALLENFTVVRLDARSGSRIVDPGGTRPPRRVWPQRSVSATARAWCRSTKARRSCAWTGCSAPSTSTRPCVTWVRVPTAVTRAAGSSRAPTASILATGQDIDIGK